MDNQTANRKIAKRMASLTCLFTPEKKAILTEVYMLDIEEKGLEANLMAHMMTLAMYKGKVKNFNWYKKLKFATRLGRLAKALKRHPKLKGFADGIKMTKNGRRK